MNPSAFHWRAFASLLLALTFLLSAVSGIVLFLRPEGSLAAWTGWSALGLDKKGWEGLHAVAIFVFLLCAAVHLACNWRVLLAYCRRRDATAPGRFRELSAALLLAAAIVAGTLGHWPPLRWLVDLRGLFKGGSAVVKAAPPLAGAEKMTLERLCPLLGIEEGQLKAVADKNGIRIDSLGQTLEEVAKLNGSTPERIFILLKAR